MFCANPQKLSYSAFTPSFCELAFHDEWEDRNTDARINTADKNSVNFDPVIREFCMRVSAGRATRCALPRISSFSYSLTDTGRQYPERTWPGASVLLQAAVVGRVAQC